LPARPSREHLRLLHERSEHGYTDQPYRAMRDEPEAVTEEEQRQLTMDAHLLARELIRQEWMMARGSIQDGIDFLASRPYAKLIGDDLRQLRRDLERTQRTLYSRL
jgi:hypothetical protein